MEILIIPSLLVGLPLSWYIGRNLEKWAQFILGLRFQVTDTHLIIRSTFKEYRGR